MRDKNRLRTLQMRVTGHDSVAGCTPLFDQRARPDGKAVDYEFNLSANIQPQIRRNLFVAASAGVQLEAELSDPIYKLKLDKVMNVLRGRMIAHPFLAGV